jgi:hypothetical protein
VTLAHTLLSRRTLLAGFLSCMASRAALAASTWRYYDKVEITAADIAWFHACRSTWIDCESGAPAIIPDDMSVEDFENEYDKPDAPVLARMERLICAFFLHASFEPGSYSFRQPVNGQPGFVVTPEHIRLLQSTHWRTAAIDCKRPYGNYTYYEIDMARTLGLPITRSAKGFAEIEPAIKARMDSLHQDLLFVLQAYIENARLAPGSWFIPFDGWQWIILPRCTPVTSWRIAKYRLSKAVIALRALFGESSFDLIVANMKASSALFE